MVMSEQEFAWKCESEGVEYAVTDYGLSAADVEDGPVRDAMLAVDAVKDAWMHAIANLENVLGTVEP